MTQYPLFPGYKATDTSQEAAGYMSLKQRPLQKKVLRMLDAWGASTADELADRCMASILAVRPRLSELRRLGLVRDSGNRRKNVSGRRAIVWELPT